MRCCATAGATFAIATVLALAGGDALARPLDAAASIQNPPTSAQCIKALGLACYSAQQLERAYNLESLYRQGIDGRGSTIVIVDLWGSPTIGSDLRAFDKAFDLPNPPVLRVLQPFGPVPPFRPTANRIDKAGETTLDVEWSHAMAPKANIVLVETNAIETANGGGFPQYMAAEDYVVKHHLGDVISQSFSIPEQNFRRGVIRRLHRTYVYAARHRVTAIASTNDHGVSGNNLTGGMWRHRVVDWPATDPLVTGVGGTELRLNLAGQRLAPDVAWNDTWDPFLENLYRQPPPLPWASTGGVSRVFRRPSYQAPVRGIVGDRRGVPDVSMSASFSGGVLVYESYTGVGSWISGGGTSESAPEFAGIVALADQYARMRLHKRRVGFINPALYKLERRRGSGIVDVTKGNNTVAFRVRKPTPRVITVRGYKARRGYDLVTGVGTINGARFVPALARAS